MYDFLIVGAGLFGSVCAFELSKRGFSVLVVEKREHVGGNVFTEKKEGIIVHSYGAHIFHTSDPFIWKYINQFAHFNSFINTPVANYKGELYNLPFNMNTFTKIWSDVRTPKEAFDKINKEIEESKIDKPTNLREQAISMVGKTLFEKLVDGYTTKQWGKRCEDLPPSIIKRLPVRMTFDNNYFDDLFQGIPSNGYTDIINKMLSKSDVKLSCDFFKNKDELERMAKIIIYSGRIDEYFDYKFGCLEYRSLVFEHKLLHIDNYQGVAVMNYTDIAIPYTRIIEHKHFDKFNKTNCTIITKEYPFDYKKTKEPFYPINDEKNSILYNKYFNEAKKKKNVYFGGRLGEYKYYDMDKVIESALSLVNRLLKDNET